MQAMAAPCFNYYEHADGFNTGRAGTLSLFFVLIIVMALPRFLFWMNFVI